MGWYDSWEVSDSKKSWSPSKSVSNFFGVSSSYGQGAQEDKFKAVLDELNRTANMLANADLDQEETNFKVKFAGNEDKEGFQQTSMVISPDLLMTDGGKLRAGGSYFDALDALNGRVLIGAHIRKTVGKDEFDRFSNSQDPVSQRCYQVVQEYHATQSLARDWKGFIPYLEQHHDMTHATKEQVETYIPTEAKMSQMGNFVAVANYNMVNSDNPVEIFDPKIKGIIDTFNSKIGTTFQSCQEAADYLRSVLVNDEPEKKEDPKGGKGKGTGGDAGSPVQIPQVFDSDVLSPDVETSKPELHKLSAGNDEDYIGNIHFHCVEESNENVIAKCEQNVKFVHGNLENAYKRTVMEHRSAIREIEKCFLFQDNICTLHSRGLSSGDIDEGNLYKVRFDPEHIYERQDTAKTSDHLLGILLDQSGSMSSRIVHARNVVITLLEGLKSYKTIKTMVYGHTAQEEDDNEECMMIPYKTPLVDNTHALAGAFARCQNLDGVAIKYMAGQMAKVEVTGKRLMIVVSDGSPSGWFYGGNAALKHTGEMVKKARKQGIQVFGIGICNAFGPREGNAMYGEGNYIVIGNVADSLKIMTNRLKRLTSSL